MLLEKNHVSKRKIAFFTLACRFFHWGTEAFSLWSGVERARTALDAAFREALQGHAAAAITCSPSAGEIAIKATAAHGI